MGFFSNLFNLNPAIEQPPLNVGFYSNIEGQQKVLKENYLDWYKSNPFVFTAINERAKAVANAKFFIRTKDGELIENELTNKLNKPNTYQNKNEFIIQLMTFKGIWGTGYLYLNRLRPSEKVDNIEIVNIPTNQILFGDKLLSSASHDFLLDILKRNNLDNFDINYCSVDQSIKKPLDKNNLLPFFDTPIFTNPYYAESRLKSQRYIVSNIQAALESQNTFLSTPGGMGMIMPDTKDASGIGIALLPEEKDEVERLLQTEYGSLTGQKSIRMLNAPIKYQSTMVDVAKLKLSETLIQNALILFGAFGLPKELLTAMMQGSTFENQKQAYKNYIQTTAQIEVDSIASSLNLAYPSREGELIGSFEHMPLMQENKKEESTVNKTDAECLKVKKEVYDDWLLKGMITEEEYKNYFNL